MQTEFIGLIIEMNFKKITNLTDGIIVTNRRESKITQKTTLLNVDSLADDRAPWFKICEIMGVQISSNF